MAGKLKITQTKSVISSPWDQKRTVRALGLKRINDTVEQDDTPVIRGMVFKVKHLVNVEEL
jgi:large subunit ribosomal protein L30